jgi:GxxExxY protein
MNVDNDNELTGRVIGAAIDVHRELGPGNDEAAYEEALSLRLSQLGIVHECQRRMPVNYRGQLLDCGLRLDVLVENRLPLELKSQEYDLPVHEAQLLTYMKLGSYPLGLLINFDVAVLKEGLRRKVLTKPHTSGSSAAFATSEFDALSVAILDAALTVHRTLGPGLLRSIYEECLCHELKLAGMAFERKRQMPLHFAGKQLTHPGELPLLVDGQVPVFCLSVGSLTPRHEATLRHRLRQGGFPFGYLLNFHAPVLVEGVRRLALSTAVSSTAEIGRSQRKKF